MVFSPLGPYCLVDYTLTPSHRISLSISLSRATGPISHPKAVEAAAEVAKVVKVAAEVTKEVAEAVEVVKEAMDAWLWRWLGALLGFDLRSQC
jgi:hypothetical protein